MAISIGSGLQDTSSPLSNDLRVSMEEKVAQLDQDETPFISMLTRMPASIAKSYKEEWMEDQRIPLNTALSASALSTDTVLSVTTNEGNYFKAGDVFRIVATGEPCRVVTAGASSLTVVRAIDGSTAASAASGGAGIIKAGGSNAQGGTLPTAMVSVKTTNYNYVGIQRDSWRFTETEQWVNYFSGDQLAQGRLNTGIWHKRQLENTIWFGGRSYSASSPPRATPGGLDHYISTNITDVGGTLDKGALNDFLRGGLEYGARNRKVLFASPIVAQVIGEFLQDNWVTAPPGTSVWGVNVDKVISAAWAGAAVPVVVKGDWKRYGEGTGRHVGSRAYLIDMTNVELVRAPATANGPRWMSLKENRQARDADEQAGEYLSEFTIRVKVEKAHALLRGVTG